MRRDEVGLWDDRRADLPDLRPDEIERLALLLEESGEVQQAIGKALRHGYESVNPLLADGPTNRGALEKEVGDFLAALDLLFRSNDLSRDSVREARREKHTSVRRWLHHQRKAGT